MTAKAPVGQKRPFRMIAGVSSMSDLIDDVSSAGGDLFVNANTAATNWLPAGNNANDGKSWNSAFLTMTYALTQVKTGGRILFIGNVSEECVGSNLVFDVTIIGMGGLHHPDLPTSAYHPGSSMWRCTATDTAPLIEVRGRGWKFINVAFDSPASYAAVKLSRNALSDASEYDASHAVFENCRFLSGKYGIDDAGGANNVTIRNCEFAGMTTAAIFGSSTAVANPRAWKVFDNMFPSNVSSLGNAVHLDASLNESIIARNYFGTVTSTGKYIDLTGGSGNIVTDNFLMGAYDTSDYVSATGDSWFGNQAISISFGTSGTNAAGVTIGIPEAAT